MKPQIRTRTRTQASAVVLFGALGLLGLPGTAHATPGACPSQIADGGSIQSSAVTDSVDQNGNVFEYQFRLCNISAFQGPSPDFAEGLLIRDWELPFFGTDLGTDNEAGITNIFTPEGWTFSLEEIGVPNFASGWDGVAVWQDTNDPFFDPRFAVGTHTHVLHFYTGCLEGGPREVDAAGPNAGGFISACNPVDPGDEARNFDGDVAFFGFDANYGPTGAPYQASWIEAPVNTGDPAFPLGGGIPNSPSLQQVPEPGTMALLATGSLLLGGAARRRRKQS